jgi:hypothetical protein
VVHEELVQVELPDGQVVWALVADAGPRDVAAGRGILGTKGLVEAIRGVGMNVRRGLADMAPDEVAVEFGLELAVHEGSVVAALVGFGGNATLKVTMGWKKAEPADADRD